MNRYKVTTVLRDNIMGNHEPRVMVVEAFSARDALTVCGYGRHGGRDIHGDTDHYSVECIEDDEGLPVDEGRLRTLLRLRFTTISEYPPDLEAEIEADIAYLTGKDEACV